MNTDRPGLAQFRSAVSSDADLQAALRAAGPQTESDVAAFAAQHGYAFTPDELKTQSELTEGELDNVTGGAGYLKYDGVDGESRDKDHKDWINLLSVSQSITRPMGG